MRLPTMVTYPFRLLAVTLLGLGLGLLTWQLIGFKGWTATTIWIRQLAYGIILLLAVAFLLAGAFWVSHSKDITTNSGAVKWGGLALVLWVVLSWVVIGVYWFYGPIYIATELIIGPCLGAGLTFLILIPIRLMQKRETMPQSETN